MNGIRKLSAESSSSKRIDSRGTIESKEGDLGHDDEAKHELGGKLARLSISALAGEDGLKCRFYVTRIGLLRNTRKVLGLGMDKFVIMDPNTGTVKEEYTFDQITHLKHVNRKPKEFSVKFNKVCETKN